MGRYRKKPIVVEATQWYKNGDHPDDYTRDIHDIDGSTITADYRRERNWEGDVVRYFRRPEAEYVGTLTHECGILWHDHGWIDTREGGHTVCPGDWIITDQDVDPANPRHGHWYYPAKPEVFEATYEAVADEGS